MRRFRVIEWVGAGITALFLLALTISVVVDLPRAAGGGYASSRGRSAGLAPILLVTIDLFFVAWFYRHWSDIRGSSQKGRSRERREQRSKRR